MANLRAPFANGEVLAVPGFDAIPALVEANRRKLDRDDVRIGGLSLRELRVLARREVLDLASEPASRARHGTGSPEPASSLTRLAKPDAPLMLAGHQPELSHPGVWVKNFALNGLAKKVGGIPLNLIVDNDTLKSTSLRFPVRPNRQPHSVHLQSMSFDTFAGEVPYEDRPVVDAEQFRTFTERAAPLWGSWDYEPLLPRVWASGGREPTVVGREAVGSRPPLATNVGEAFTAMRREREHEWGCDNRELRVSRLSQTTAFQHFARHVLDNLPQFQAVYNAAIRAYREANGIRSANHPAPELAEGEAPFWVRVGTGRRLKATPASDPANLRPRALTLTLFARVCLGDFFIHGIGGGKYDEVTDAIIRDYFGVEPPAYQVLSATLHLPLPGFPSTGDDLKKAEHLVRDLHWNPDRHLTPENRERPEVRALVCRKATFAASEPPRDAPAARRAWFRELHGLTTELRSFVWKQIPAAKSSLARVRAEVEANGTLRRRDYSWVLYPEETLRPFLQRFLTV